MNLDFLNKSHKAVTPPLIVFTDSLGEHDGGGYYCVPRQGERLIESRMYPASRGIIVLSESCCATNTELAASLAHEYRHHLQHFYGIKYDHKDWGTLYKLYGYERAIKLYFQQSRTEMDALIYQRRYAGHKQSEFTEYWCGLVGIRSDLHPTFFFAPNKCLTL